MQLLIASCSCDGKLISLPSRISNEMQKGPRSVLVVCNSQIRNSKFLIVRVNLNAAFDVCQWLWLLDKCRMSSHLMLSYFSCTRSCPSSLSPALTPRPLTHSLPSSFLERCARTHTAAAAAAAGALLSFQRPLSNAIIHVYDAMTSSPSLILKVLCDLIPK